MEITHITRGIEWLSTAPVHVNLFQAFGWEMPVFVHLPVILSPSGKGKLSKRSPAGDAACRIWFRSDTAMASFHGDRGA
jgi:glutamyl-tRNA synthetase